MGRESHINKNLMTLLVGLSFQIFENVLMKFYYFIRLQVTTMIRLTLEHY